MDNKIKNWVTPNPAVADSQEMLVNAIQTMAAKRIGAILVRRNGKLEGIFTERDLLRLFSNNTEKAFNEARQEIENLKKLVGVADSEKIETLIREVQRYRELCLTDHLTGLFNKRYFQTRIVEEVTRAKRSSYDLSLIFCDIDYFKRVNDRFGHHIGDEVLRTTARVLTRGQRPHGNHQERRLRHVQGKELR
jgi:GGDEF domain-containing protein